MKRLFLGLVLASGMFACGGDVGGGGSGGATIDAPYESCGQYDGCSGGTACIQSTVPTGYYAGYFCSNGCNSSADCLQDLNNYDAICVNGACYIQCPTGGQTCPYGTGCFAFTDQTNSEVDLCTP